jgi:hypothetical protein
MKGLSPENIPLDIPIRSRYSVVPTAEQWQQLDEFIEELEVGEVDRYELEEGKHTVTLQRVRSCVYAAAFF